MDKLFEKRNARLVITAIGLLLFFLPLLGSFGLWDPHEIKIADAAKALAQSGSWTMKASTSQPPAPLWLVAVGFRLFGASELGGRLPIALASLAALLFGYRLGRSLLSPRGAVLGALALATSVTFFLGSHQLTTNILPTLAATMALAGLAPATFPRPEDERWRWLNFAVGGVGLGLGFFASGLLLGVAVPLAALGFALLASGAARTAWLGVLAAAAAASGTVAWVWQSGLAGGGRAGYSAILGGVVHASNQQVQLITVAKQIGFGLAPWVALLPIAVARAFDSDETDDPAAARRERFGRLLLLLWIVVAYFATTLHVASIGDAGFAAPAGVALLVGALLDHALDDPHRLGVLGVIALFGAVILGHDFFLQPESWAGAHVFEGIKWPSPLELAPYVILGFVCLFGLLVGIGFVVTPRPGKWGRQSFLYGAVAAALLHAVVTTFWIIPDVSKHLSFKGLFTKFQSLGGDGGELGRYHVPASITWGQSGKTTDLGGLPELFDFLARPQRVFAMVSSDDLAPIDQFSRSRAKTTPGQTSPYYVVDDSNIHFQLLSNRLGPGDQDLNPLRRLIVKTLAKPPQHELHADFEGKVELVGYDLPPELERGRKFKITLYYLVKQPLSSSYKVFLHFDGPGNRFNGDHVPLDGRFPTNYWVPGFYVIDEHEMEPDRATAPAGWYQIYAGLFLGGDRLKVIAGSHDGEHRVKVGSVRVK